MSRLFVYGTLRRRSEHAMARLLRQHSTFVGEAYFHGRLFMIETYPGAVPSDTPGDLVHGEVYELARPQWLLAILDEYEGYRAQQDDGAYLRRQHPVTLGSGAVVPAWIYLYNRPTQQLQRIASGEFCAGG